MHLFEMCHQFDHSDHCIQIYPPDNVVFDAVMQFPQGRLCWCRRTLRHCGYRPTVLCSIQAPAKAE